MQQPMPVPGRRSDVDLPPDQGADPRFADPRMPTRALRSALRATRQSEFRRNAQSRRTARRCLRSECQSERARRAASARCVAARSALGASGGGRRWRAGARRAARSLEHGGQRSLAPRHRAAAAAAAADERHRCRRGAAARQYAARSFRSRLSDSCGRRTMPSAEQTFRDFLQRFPSDRLAGDANYWLGESLYNRRQYQDAAEAYLVVTTKLRHRGPRARCAASSRPVARGHPPEGNGLRVVCRDRTQISACVGRRETGGGAGTAACRLLTQQAVSLAEAGRLFAPFADQANILIAVSGGPDSTALLWLAARWRAGRKNGPDILAITVDHGLRAEFGPRGERGEAPRAKPRRRPSHRSLARRQAQDRHSGGRPRCALRPDRGRCEEGGRPPCADRPYARRSGRDRAAAAPARQRSGRSAGDDGDCALSRRARSLAGAAATLDAEGASGRDPAQGRHRVRRRSEQPRSAPHPPAAPRRSCRSLPPRG